MSMHKNKILFLIDWLKLPKSVNANILIAVVFKKFFVLQYQFECNIFDHL